MKILVFLIATGLIISLFFGIVQLNEDKDIEGECIKVEPRVYPNDFIGPLRPCDKYESEVDDGRLS